MTQGPGEPGPIVVGVERSERSRDALALARVLAGDLGHAADPRLGAPRRPRSHAMAQEAEASPRLGGASARPGARRSASRPCSSVPRRPPGGRGRRGRSGDRGRPVTPRAGGRIVPGSVGERLLHGAPARWRWRRATTRRQAETGIKRIGVGYTAGPEAGEALSAAVGLAARTGAALRLLSVVEPSTVAATLPLGWGFGELDATERDDLAGRSGTRSRTSPPPRTSPVTWSTAMPMTSSRGSRAKSTS